MSTNSNTYSETKKVFGVAEVSKVDLHGWTIVDEPGEFERIHKRDLNVDAGYQRTNVNNMRVLDIAREWSHAACGCLIVALRPDGTKWVCDGQHRKLAADKRSDIQYLPCLVFNLDERSDEAGVFVRANTVRGPVSSFNKFRASVVAGDAAALAVRDLIEEHGYSAGSTPSKGVIACVRTLMKEYGDNPEVCRRVFSLCANLARGEIISGDVFASLCYLECYLSRKSSGSLTDATNLRRLKALGMSGMEAAINNSKMYHQKGGPKIGAQGIADHLNKDRSSGVIPYILQGG